MKKLLKTLALCFVALLARLGLLPVSMSFPTKCKEAYPTHNTATLHRTTLFSQNVEMKPLLQFKPKENKNKYGKEPTEMYFWLLITELKSLFKYLLSVFGTHS